MPLLAPTRGFLVEYALALPPLVLAFDFNPQTLTRNRSVTLTLGSTPATRGGYDFALPTETARVAQGVAVEPESFDLEILLDATDRLNDGEPIATEFGIQPELDTLRSMVEPKTQGPGGLQVLASLGLGGQRAFQRAQCASVLLWVWGRHILPVFLKSIEVTESAHLPNLVPYRATLKLGLQVIEGNNPFYEAEKLQQFIGSGLNTGRTAGAAIGGLF
ncbi:hypothetical protein [Ideonella sp. B508-1]|uniref:hypothetical protein n=1 Tax=Ideonella sp. B508-1 TaxID=137716 RepID=UPI0003462D5B|nr:hypothetical protein [Ideonella sp. B508-1]